MHRSAAAGYVLLDPASGRTGALVQAFAAGALLAMLTDTLLPEAYEVEGVLTGPLVVAGFALSLALSAIRSGVRPGCLPRWGGLVDCHERRM